jgi:hypothetical protein
LIPIKKGSAQLINWETANICTTVTKWINRELRPRSSGLSKPRCPMIRISWSNHHLPAQSLRGIMMKAQYRYSYWLVLALQTLSACESGAELRFSTAPATRFCEDGRHFRSSIPAGGEHSFDVETETQSFLTGTIREAKTVWAIARPTGFMTDSQ